MHASARAFLNQIIDYAGLFPPAKLPLEPALQNYLRYRNDSPHAWMLGRFVCPTAKLAEAIALAKANPGKDKLAITALGQQAPAGEFLATLQSDIEAIQKARHAWGSGEVIDMIEFALPKDAPIPELADLLVNAKFTIAMADLKGFLEVPYTPTWRRDVDAICKLFDSPQEMEGMGLKIRTGGLTPEAFPSDADVAFFIARCQSAKAPWKATAGLHHPRRHWDASIKVWHHGFLNVFGAGLLAATNSLTEADIAEILADREGQHFHFESDQFGWKNWTCSTAQIAKHRIDCATTFGSCSFDEPCDDLTAMGLIG